MAITYGAELELSLSGKSILPKMEPNPILLIKHQLLPSSIAFSGIHLYLGLYLIPNPLI